MVISCLKKGNNLRAIKITVSDRLSSECLDVPVRGMAQSTKLHYAKEIKSENATTILKKQ